MLQYDISALSSDYSILNSTIEFRSDVAHKISDKNENMKLKLGLLFKLTDDLFQLKNKPT